jgi:hypothetical protein
MEFLRTSTGFEVRAWVRSNAKGLFPHAGKWYGEDFHLSRKFVRLKRALREPLGNRTLLKERGTANNGFSPRKKTSLVLPEHFVPYTASR